MCVYDMWGHPHPKKKSSLAKKNNGNSGKNLDQSEATSVKSLPEGPIPGTLPSIVMSFVAHREGGFSDFSWYDLFFPPRVYFFRSSRNDYILTSSTVDNSVKLWDWDKRQKIAMFNFQKGVSALSFNPVRS